MTRVALYGGSFNPPHVSHQLISLLVLETCPVDELWWLPTHRHAFEKKLAPWDDRVAMCRLATARLGDEVSVCTIEAELSGEENRTFHTLEALAARHPDASFRLVVGADILAESESWFRWDEVVRAAPPIVIERDGFSAGPYASSALPAVPAVSSTEIRRHLAAGESAVPLVSRSVMDYIARGGLYR